MEEIKEIVKTVLENISSKSPQGMQPVEKIWDGLLKEKERRHTRIIGLKNGQLLVSVDAPAWLFQLNLKKRKITENLQRECPEIKGISFKIGKTT